MTCLNINFLTDIVRNKHWIILTYHLIQIPEMKGCVNTHLCDTTVMAQFIKQLSAIMEQQ
jgi:hypothetical protein